MKPLKLSTIQISILAALSLDPSQQYELEDLRQPANRRHVMDLRDLQKVCEAASEAAVIELACLGLVDYSSKEVDPVPNLALTVKGRKTLQENIYPPTAKPNDRVAICQHGYVAAGGQCAHCAGLQPPFSGPTYFVPWRWLRELPAFAAANRLPDEKSPVAEAGAEQRLARHCKYGNVTTSGGSHGIVTATVVPLPR